ncbi:MAG: patatin-like phospholipase family protein, partial [Deltaproteobacteria bacterium]|nr:patatin-like phospholipase family protein [Deltaproteobacteria bacterium]
MDNKPNCIIQLAVPLLLAAFLPAACSLYSHTNIEAGDNQRPIGENDAISSSAELASLNIPWNLEPDCLKKVRRLEDRKKCEADGNDGNFVAMSISGGGSRSAVFSAQVMFELQRYGVLQQVDMISSVSGGSYTAAFYALSCDDPAVCPETVEGPDRFLWTEEEVFPMLQKNFKGRWIANLFWPDNMIRYWFTAYDRTDIMAETLSDNLFDNSMTGNEGFRFQDLNPQRPHLIINATNNTRDDFKPLSPTPEKLSSCGYKQGVPPGCHADLM